MKDSSLLLSYSFIFIPLLFARFKILSKDGVFYLASEREALKIDISYSSKRPFLNGLFSSHIIGKEALLLIKPGPNFQGKLEAFPPFLIKREPAGKAPQKLKPLILTKGILSGAHEETKPGGEPSKGQPTKNILKGGRFPTEKGQIPRKMGHNLTNP